MIPYKSKYDYLKHSREPFHTTLRSDLHKKFAMLKVETQQNNSKMLDVLLDELFSNEERLQEFKLKVANYR